MPARQTFSFFLFFLSAESACKCSSTPAQLRLCLDGNLWNAGVATQWRNDIHLPWHTGKFALGKTLLWKERGEFTNADLMELLTATVSLKISPSLFIPQPEFEWDPHGYRNFFIFRLPIRLSLPFLFSLSLRGTSKTLSISKKASPLYLLTFKVPSPWGKWKGISLK